MFTKKWIYLSKWDKSFSNRGHTCISSKAPLSVQIFRLVPKFAQFISELCLINNVFVNLIYDYRGHLFSNLNQPWLSTNFLERFSKCCL